jgi:putative hydrolase of the HAD superfamily
MGGTLITGATLEDVIEVYDRILRAYGVSCSLDEIAMAHQKTYKRIDIKHLPEMSRNFWVKFNIIFLEELGMKREDVLDLAKAIDREWWDYAEVTLYPDVLPVLQELKARNLKLGIISNGLESDIEYVMKKVNLKGFFDVEVGVDTFKCMKPDREIFIKTLKMLGVSPKEALFVGDSLENDYRGAVNAGMKALLIDRNNRVSNCEAQIIRSFWELLRFL